MALFYVLQIMLISSTMAEEFYDMILDLLSDRQIMNSNKFIIKDTMSERPILKPRILP